MAAALILVEASPRRAADGAPVPVRLAGGGAIAPYYYGGQHYRAGVTSLPRSIASLDFDGEQLGGGGVAQALELGWAAATNAALSELSELFWKDAPITVRLGPEGAGLPPVATSGLVLETAVADGVLRIALADQAVDLKRALLTDRYAGTGGIEGPPEWEGQIKTRAWGRCFNVPGRCIDTANNIWCFGDPGRPWQAFDQVRDQGARALPDNLSLLAWQGNAAATFAALQGAVATAGGGVLCPSIASIKWWTEPGGLHADVRGETAGGYVETAPEIATRIVASRSTLGFAAGAVASAAAARPAPFGWRVDNDSATAAGELSELLAGVSLSWTIVDGAIDFRPWEWTAPTRVARSESVTRRQVYAPVATRKLGHRRNWAPMARGDLRAIVFAEDVAYEDGTPISDLRPAEIGATAGAPSGTAVAGVPADDVVSEIAASTARLDAFEEVTIPAIDAAIGAANDQISDAGVRIIEARAAADAAKGRADDAFVEIGSQVVTINQRIDSVEAGSGYDDTAVFAEVARVDSAAIGRDAALGESIETVSASINTADANLRALVETKEQAAVGRETAISQRIDTIVAESGDGDTDVFARSEITRVEQAAIGRDDAISTRQDAFQASYVIGSGNWLTNTDLATLDGWASSQNLTNGAGPLINLAGDPWHPVGENVLSLYQTAPVGDPTFYHEIIGAPFPVVAGSYLQFYAFTASHRALAWVSLYFYAADGSNVGYGGENTGAAVDNGGRDPANFNQTGVKAMLVPPAAVSGRMILRKYDTYPGQVDSYAWFWRPYVGSARAGQTSWNPFSPGNGRAVQVETSARINDRFTTFADVDTALAQRALALEAAAGPLNSRVTATETAVNDGRFATAQRAITLETRADTADAQLAGTTGSGLSGRIATVETATTDGRFATAQRASTIEAAAGQLASRVTATETATTDGRFATAQRATTLEARADTTDAQLAGTTGSGLGARLTTVETATTDGRFATAQRAATIEATAGSLAARVTTTETATTDGRFAAATTVTQLRSEYNGTAASVTAQAGTITGLGQRTAAYWQVQSVAGDNRALLRVVADANGGGGVDIVGDLRLSGTALFDRLSNLAGTVVYYLDTGIQTIVAGAYRKVSGASFGVSGDLMEWWGSNAIARGQETKANALWALAVDGSIVQGTAPTGSGAAPGASGVTTKAGALGDTLTDVFVRSGAVVPFFARRLVSLYRGSDGDTCYTTVAVSPAEANAWTVIGEAQTTGYYNQAAIGEVSGSWTNTGSDNVFDFSSSTDVFGVGTSTNYFRVGNV